MATAVSHGQSSRDACGPNPVWTAGVSPASIDTPGTGQIGSHSRGYLPHLDAPGLVQHVVFRLADSLPKAILDDLARQQPRERHGATDAALDPGYGRRDLGDLRIAALVQAALLAFERQRYGLWAWCVMPNHVHVLLRAKSGHPLNSIVHSWKSYTAKEASRLLDRTGRFWAREYFDRIVRNDNDLRRTVAYIEANPVKVGLCKSTEEWPFSSASRWSNGRLSIEKDCRRDAGGPCVGE